MKPNQVNDFAKEKESVDLQAKFCLFIGSIQEREMENVEHKLNMVIKHHTQRTFVAMGETYGKSVNIEFEQPFLISEIKQIQKMVAK